MPVLGHQAKTQLAPVEDGHYVPGRGRSVFTASGVTFGIAICTEGFRYPETVRWAARAGAQVVFHPHFEGSSTPGSPPRQWCDPGNSYHEKAVVCRAVENAVYVASCNYALADQRSATCVVDPEGGLAGRLGYGEAGCLPRTSTSPGLRGRLPFDTRQSASRLADGAVGFRAAAGSPVSRHYARGRGIRDGLQ